MAAPGRHDEMLGVNELGATASTSSGRSEVGETTGSAVGRPSHYSAPRLVVESPSANSTCSGRSPLDGRTTFDNDLSLQLGSMRLGPDAETERRIHDAARKYEIRTADIERLRKLKNFDVVILCDDSGSMSTPIDGMTTTRWDQLRKFVQLVAEISTIFDSNGIDIHFLNRQDTYRITDPEDAKHLFDDPPSGFTPLTRALRRILELPAARRGYDKKLLVFIATDGTPTDDNGEPDVVGFEHVMRSERQAETTHVMFLICTDDLDSVQYLRQWDRTMENVDVTNDYQNQRREVQAIHGPNYSFPMNAYVVKTLIGAIEPRIDRIDD